MDIPNFIPETFYAPVGSGLVEGLCDVDVEGRTLFQDLVEGELANFGAHGGLGELRDSVFGIFHAVGGFVSVENSDVEDALSGVSRRTELREKDATEGATYIEV